jgi:hypothetical protein
VAVTGDLRCCTYAGSRCGFDAACCGAASCVNGYCANIAVEGGVSGPGEPCQNASQCVAADTALTCDYVAATDDYRCCALEGSRCGWDGGCCGWLTCQGGFCASGASASCTGPGCDCIDGPYAACDPGLICCGASGVPTGPGICMTEADCYPVCSGRGCYCDFHDPNACAPGLVCCAVQSGFICATRADCGMG